MARVQMCVSGPKDRNLLTIPKKKKPYLRTGIGGPLRRAPLRIHTPMTIKRCPNVNKQILRIVTKHQMGR